MTTRDWAFDTPDGCSWTIGWMDDAEGWLVDVWVDEDDPPPTSCTCAHPEDGLFDSLETVELAIGSPIPINIRDQLLAEAACHRSPESARAAWGRIFALEVIRVDEDGTFWTSFAPTWADDPVSPYWDPDNFPLVD